MADSQRICSVDDCGNPAWARGWCKSHYARWRTKGDPLICRPIYPTTCSVEGCGEGGQIIKGMCKEHYDQHRRQGDPLRRQRSRRGAALEWLLSNVDHEGDECLIWPFPRPRHGYGTVCVGGRKQVASREMCERVNGQAPTPEHQAAHSCGNGHLGCVHPKHLRWATPQENQIERADHGTSNRGERQHMATLTAENVLEIRAKKLRGLGPALALEYGVSEATIHSVWARRSWAWLE